MMLVLLILCVAILIATRQIRVGQQVAIGGLWLSGVWLVTFVSHLVREFVQTDEVFYAGASEYSLFANRSLWLVLNTLASLFSDDVINHMRVFNWGVLLVVYGIAVRTFRSFSPISIAFMMSYFACVAALNLRDVALLGAFLLILKRFDPTGLNVVALRRQLSRLIMPALMMFMLRPLQLGFIAVSILRWYYMVVVILVAVVVLQTPLGERYFYTTAWTLANFEESTFERGTDKVVDPSPTITNIVQWSARFVLAPLPWTSLERIFTDTDYEYGRVDLVVRAFHRLIFYIFLLYLMYEYLRRPSGFFLVMQCYSYVVKFILLFTVVYAVFNFGGSHERIKLNLFLSVLFLIDRIRQQSRSACHA